MSAAAVIARFLDEDERPLFVAPLPCPFCGVHGHIELTDDNGDAEPWAAFCGGCGSAGPVASTHEAAALEWNRRAGVRRG